MPASSPLMTLSFSRDQLGMARSIAAGLLTSLVLIGCASAPPPSELDQLDYRSRAITRSNGDIKVSASTLSADESRNVYGFPLAKKGIQPVWIQVDNNEDQAYWLMSTGLDPNFFPASEAAEAFVSTHKDETRDVLVPRFEALAFRGPIPPGKTVSGFILTNLDEGVKLVHVDLVAERRHKSFSFFTRIPGFRADYVSREKINDAYSDDDYTDYSDDNAFRAALEALPCCVRPNMGLVNSAAVMSRASSNRVIRST